MSRLLIAAAGLCAAALPLSADAQQFAAPSGGVSVHVGSGGFGGGQHHRRDRRGGPVVLYDVGSPYAWAYYNNRSFAPDSFNDWWHDRPDRSMPRWVGQNVGCERMWWSGGAWRC